VENNNLGSKNRYANIAALILSTVIIWISLAGCSFVRHGIAAARSTDHFISNQNDPRVLYEPGAEDFAEKIVPMIASAIRQIEDKQYRPFSEAVRVYICSTRDSFKKHYGADVRAGVLTKLFLSPRVFEQDDDIVYLYLAHELSHLHLLQQLGVYKMSRLPMWFKEGLATYASGGGGAHLVSEDRAAEAIISGKHLIPNDTAGFIFQKTPSDFNLKPHMFYRQSMMFIEFMSSKNESEFQKLLLDVQNGEQLSDALRKGYNSELRELWHAFLQTIKRKG
jgi:hypothetical protein